MNVRFYLEEQKKNKKKKCIFLFFPLLSAAFIRTLLNYSCVIFVFDSVARLGKKNQSKGMKRAKQKEEIVKGKQRGGVRVRQGNSGPTGVSSVSGRRCLPLQPPLRASYLFAVLPACLR